MDRDMKFDEDLLRQELAPILFRHMQVAGHDPEKLATVYETLSSMLGNAVAQGCRGDAKLMGVMLEGLSAHMMEVAAERAPVMQLLGKFR
jgi:hypothetical protein